MAVDPTTVTLPPELLPGDGRFGSGPSKVRAEAAARPRRRRRHATSAPATASRRCASVVGRIRAGLADLFALPDGYEVLLGNGGSTAFWDAAAFGLVERRAEHLVFGEFSSKFAAVTAAAPFLDDPVVLESEPGTHPELVADADRRRVRVPAQRDVHRRDDRRAPPRRPTASCSSTPRRAPAGCASTRRSSTSTTSRRRSASPATAASGSRCCSPAAIERIERLGAADRWVPPSLSLPIALENSRLDQTYNTPALASLFLLDAQRAAGCSTRAGSTGPPAAATARPRSLYGWAEASTFATPFVAKPSERSHVIGTIDFADDVDAAAIAAALRANGIVDTEPYRKLGRNQLRIAMFPAIEPDDVATLTPRIDYLAEALR